MNKTSVIICNHCNQVFIPDQDQVTEFGQFSSRTCPLCKQVIGEFEEVWIDVPKMAEELEELKKKSEEYLKVLALVAAKSEFGGRITVTKDSLEWLVSNLELLRMENGDGSLIYFYPRRK